MTIPSGNKLAHFSNQHTLPHKKKQTTTSDEPFTTTGKNLLKLELGPRMGIETGGGSCFQGVATPPVGVRCQVIGCDGHVP